MLKIDGQGICTPVHPGKVQLTFTFATLASRAVVLEIKPPGPPPADLKVVPYITTAAVQFENRATESRRST